MNQDKYTYTNKNGYSCIPENRIIASYDEWIDKILSPILMYVG